MYSLTDREYTAWGGRGLDGEEMSAQRGSYWLISRIFFYNIPYIISYC